MSRSATCVWRCSDELILALAGHFGPPADAYVNGSQVWLRDDGPGETTVEYRLHPVAAYRRPRGAGTHELFEEVADAVAAGRSGPAPPEELWGGLEAYAAYGDEIEPATLAETATRALGLAPDAFGLVDHGRLGEEWENSRGKISLAHAVLTELETA